MILKHLNLYNFGSYKDCELDLSGLNLCSIIGGNGSGKSTIIEAVLWAIYGTAKLGNKELLHSGVEEMEVDLTFEMDGKTYQIERSYNDSMRVTVMVDGVSIASGNAAIALALNKAMGASKEMLMESIVVSQGQLSSFVNSTPAQRRDLIITMLGLGKYAGAWETAKDGLKTMVVQVSTHNQNVDATKKQIEQGPDDAAITGQIKRLREEIGVGQKKFEELTQQKADVMAGNEQTAISMNKCREEINKLSSKIPSTKVRLDGDIQRLVYALSESDKQTSKLDILKDDIIRMEQELEVSQIGIERLKGLRQSIMDYEERIKQRRETTRLIDEGKNKCPLCNSDISQEQWREILRSANEELTNLVKSLDATSREVTLVVIPGDPDKIKEGITVCRDGISKAEMLAGSRKILSDQIEGA